MQWLRHSAACAGSKIHMSRLPTPWRAKVARNGGPDYGAWILVYATAWFFATVT